VPTQTRADQQASKKDPRGQPARDTKEEVNMYGVITNVPAPVEMYDAMHAEMIKRAGASIDGLLVHVGPATTDGFQILEVWESKEHYDRANTDIVFPLLRELAGDQPQPAAEQATEAFDVHGLVIPGVNILV
jgi:hypothetical protein